MMCLLRRCYSTSPDNARWTKPWLGMCEPACTLAVMRCSDKSDNCFSALYTRNWLVYAPLATTGSLYIHNAVYAIGTFCVLSANCAGINIFCRQFHATVPSAHFRMMPLSLFLPFFLFHFCLVHKFLHFYRLFFSFCLWLSLFCACLAFLPFFTVSTLPKVAR